jgi:transposase
MGVPAPGNGLWQRHDLLASSARLAGSWCLAQNMAGFAGRTGTGRCDRLVLFCDGQLFSPRTFWGAKTGPNPTDRGKNGSKRHLIVDGQGTPLAIEHTGANVHDSEMAIALVDGIPPIKQPRGRPRKRPDEVLADRAYDAEQKIRKPLRRRKTEPLIAKRNTTHGSGLGKFRYVVEAAFDWLFNQRRLRVRYEKRDDIHQAFLIIGCFLICWRRIIEFC